MWSKPLLCRFLQPGEIPQTQVSQGFATFRLTLSRIQPRHSQTTRATNCATPGYIYILVCFLLIIFPLRFPQKHSRGSSLGALAPLLVSSPRSNASIRPRRRHFSSPNCATPGYIYILVCFLLIIFPLRFPQKHSRGSSLGALAPLLVSSPRSNASIRPRRRHFSSPNCATPGYIYILVCFLLISFLILIRGASLRNIVA